MLAAGQRPSSAALLTWELWGQSCDLAPWPTWQASQPSPFLLVTTLQVRVRVDVVR